MNVEVTTWSLQMTDPAQLRPTRHDGAGLQIKQVEIPCPEYNRFFYTAVGGGWYWINRLQWSYAQWADWVARPELETWVVYASGTPAGYYELEQQRGGSVEIAYFGLLPQFVGQGIGGFLLTAALRRAWEMPGTQRVWVHTCSLDHPNALAAYQARGLRIFQEVVHIENLPTETPGPWPNAS